jgi:ribosomal protein S27AE
MCKDCKRERYRESRKEYDRKYRLENAPRLNELKKAWRKSNPKSRYEKDPERRKARMLVASAIRNGSLVSPPACEDCGRSDTLLNGHHDDYSKPLDVRWLCGACHMYFHAHGERRMAA